jgi:hypothetical protein
VGAATMPVKVIIQPDASQQGKSRDLWHELRDAMKRVRRKPRLIYGFFRGAKL